jgi:hypothetical protein
MGIFVHDHHLHTMKTFQILLAALAVSLVAMASGLSGSPPVVHGWAPRQARPDPDSSLGPIVLRSQHSTAASLGQDIPMDEWKEMYCTRLRSRDARQLAVLWFHPGDGMGAFSEIEVSYSYHVAGMPTRKPIIVDWPFVTESGIALGVHYKQVIGTKGRPTSQWATSKNIVLKYAFAPAKWSHPAAHFNMPQYAARYTFSKDSVLTAFSFGFPYP